MLDSNPDTSLNINLLNRITFPNPHIHTELIKFIKCYKPNDTFRLKNGVKAEYSFETATGGSRLDHLLVSNNLTHLVLDAKYGKLNRSLDHKYVCCNFSGPQTCKKRPIILRDLYKTKMFCNIIKSSFIAASLEEVGLLAEIDPIFKIFLRYPVKFRLLENIWLTITITG